MNEAFLQYLWQHRLFEGDMSTTDGLSVIVENPGSLNRDAGPDFFDARLRIGDIKWAGNVEIHVRASDWKAHHHSDDKNYNNVILHVVYINDTEIVLENGKTVPTLVVESHVPDKVWDNYDKLMNAASNKEIACSSRLDEIPEFLFQLSQDRLIVERMERKADDVQRIMRESKDNWEQACYWLVARYFGGKVNSFQFELLAKKTPLNIIAKIKDNPFRVEALLLGQAGLLEGPFVDDYPKALKKEYDYLSIAYHLSPMPGHLWKFFRLRPASFPTLRISQLAGLMVKSSNLFSHLLESDDVDSLRKLFTVSASDYWNTHYSFDKEVPFRPKSLGKTIVDTILINAWVPLLFRYGVTHGDQTCKDKAFSLLQKLPSESNRIVKLWESEGIKPHNAAESQSLIQRYNEYCSRKRCLECQLAYRLIKS